ncbi:hypothetical protein GGR57DRAFT_510619 [Xylariaceae sp. FL1272]|nr:hypothetical protein GGR57DRAFT_510619 [Xylariaceae sp. FL1272]
MSSTPQESSGRLQNTQLVPPSWLPNIPLRANVTKLSNSILCKPSQASSRGNTRQRSYLSKIASVLVCWGQSVLRAFGWASSPDGPIVTRGPGMAFTFTTGPTIIETTSGGYAWVRKSQDHVPGNEAIRRQNSTPLPSPTRDFIRAEYKRGNRYRKKHHKHTAALYALFPELATFGFQGSKELKWAKFEKFMAALDFEKEQGDGSSVRFTPTFPNRIIKVNHIGSTFHVDQPHKPNSPHRWDVVTSKKYGNQLREQYGWKPKDFLNW